MMNINLILPLVMFILGCLVFVSNRKYLLVTLLSLEFIVLSLYYFLFMGLNLFDSEMYLTMVFLTFSVCEGALGLSLLVSMIRTHGNNYFQSYSILLC